ncbi:hypothetical protein FWH13_02315 [Candidatus Saccharibacteria bacterium]|nr:hypothetical protein [Candidatus Saccharibacteria bacterium]
MSLEKKRKGRKVGVIVAVVAAVLAILFVPMVPVEYYNMCGGDPCEGVRGYDRNNPGLVACPSVCVPITAEERASVVRLMVMTVRGDFEEGGWSFR